MNKLEATVLRELQKTMLKIRMLAIKYGRNFNLKSNELRDLHFTIRNAQVLAYLMGRRRARTAIPGIKADYISDAIAAFKNVNKAKLAAITSHYDIETMKVISDMTLNVNKRVRNALADAAQKQLQTQSATELLVQALDKSGITPTNSYYAENIVRTYTQSAYNAARWQEYQSEEISDILWGYTYVTVGDDRVRDEHVKLDGVTLPKDDPFWLRFWPPNGWSCRCQVIPVFDKERVKRPPSDAQPDSGFGFNSGQLIKSLGI